jgi:hypothetical protein
MLKKSIFLVTALLFGEPAFAAHPLITDDAGTQGKGHVQLEINSEFARNRETEKGTGIRETGSEITAALSYGLSETIDLVVGLPFVWYKIEENGITVADESGIGDISLEMKWRMYESKDGNFSLALKPGLSLPSGNENKGLGSGKVSGGVVLIATKEGQLGAIHGNIGFTHNEYKLEEESDNTRKDIWHASLAAEMNLAENLRGVANIGIETSDEPHAENHPAFLLGGLIYSLSDDLDLDLGIKTGLNDAETDTTLLAGIAARF